MPKADKKEFQIGKDSKLVMYSEDIFISDYEGDTVQLKGEEAVEIANIILEHAQTNVVFNVD